jgi:hypothetical protein
MPNPYQQFGTINDELLKKKDAVYVFASRLLSFVALSFSIPPL